MSREDRSLGQAYRREVQLFLLLSYCFLVGLNLFSAWTLLRTRRLLGDELADRCAQVSVFVERALAPELTEIGNGPARLHPTSPALQDAAQTWALVGIEVLGANGVPLASSYSSARRGDRFAVLAAGERAQLEIGAQVLSQPHQPPEAAAPVVSVFHRILATPAFVRLDFDAGPIVERDRAIRSLVAINVGAALGMMALLFFFMHRILAPYDALLARARAAELLEPYGADPPPAGDETQYLVRTFEATIAALESSKQELAELHRRAQERVGELEVLTDTLSRNMPSGLLTLDAEGELLAINGAGREILGLPPAAAGRPATAALALFPELAALALAALQREAPSQGEVVADRGGERLLLAVTATPIRERSGRLLGVLAMFDDLTPVKALEERVRVRENLANLGEFSAGIAHEFRNSLATILGYLKLLEGDRDPADATRHIAELRREAEHVNQVVQQFLIFARPRELQVAPVDLAALVAAVARRSGEQSAVAIEIEGELATVSGDEVLLRQVLTNLVGNALDATVAAGRDDAVRIRGEIDAAGRRQVLRVEDRGNGIPAASLAKVFIPFYSTKEAGTGMGLALVHKIVILHGGEVEVASREGEGSVFTVRLPFGEPAA